MKKHFKYLLAFTLCNISTIVYGVVKYDLNSNDTIVDVSSPTFKYSIKLSTMDAPSVPDSGGLIYMSTDNKIYFKDMTGNNYDLTQATGELFNNYISTNSYGVNISTGISVTNKLFFGSDTYFDFNGSTISLYLNGLLVDSWYNSTSIPYVKYNGVNLLYKGIKIAYP